MLKEPSDWARSFSGVATQIAASQTLVNDFESLCSLGGRFAGTESEARARHYLGRRLAEVSGKKVLEWPVPYRGWDRGRGSVTIENGSRLAATPLGRSPSTSPLGLRAPLLDLGRGAPDDFARAGENLRGRIALVRHEYMLGSDHIHRRQKYAMAKAAGATGFLIASNVPGELLVTGSAGSLAPDDIPAAGISMESGAALGTQRADVILNVQGAFHDRTATNLTIEIPGKTNEFIVLCAHIDGHDLASSAIDNASGLSCALAVTEALRIVIPDLRRGVMVAFFNVEEWAVIGSRHFLETMPEAKRRRLSFNVNLDSVAGSSRLAVMTSGVSAADAALSRANSEFGLGLRRHARFMDNSDHSNFIRCGIPALRLCAGLDEPESNLRFLLTSGDTADKVRASELRAAAVAAAGLILAVAGAEIDQLSDDAVRAITAK